MDASTWAAVAAVGSVITAGISLFALKATQKSIRIQTKSNDVGTAFHILDAIERMDLRLQTARADGYETWKREVISWMNHLETLCLLLHENCFPPATIKIVEPILKEYLRTINNTLDLREIIVNAVTGPTTFRHIQLLAAKYKSEIGTLTDDLQKAAA